MTRQVLVLTDRSLRGRCGVAGIALLGRTAMVRHRSQVALVVVTMILLHAHPAAWLFAAIFLLQAALFFRSG